MTIYDQDIDAQGQYGEDQFTAWLNKFGLSYLYINQHPDHFATMFSETVKRPDFLVLLDSIGMLAVDVKNHTASGGVLTLSWELETARVLAFERIFRIPFWYAYLQERDGKEVWFWISALKAVEVGERRINGKTGLEFLAIKLDDFQKISEGEDLGRLFTQRMPGYKNVKGIATKAPAAQAKNLPE